METTPLLDTKIEMICRYCCSGDDIDKMIAPCACDGTCKYVHIDCLKRWLDTNSYINMTCEICNHRLNIDYTKKRNWCFELSMRSILIILSSCLLVLSIKIIIDGIYTFENIFVMIASFIGWIAFSYVAIMINLEPGKKMF